MPRKELGMAGCNSGSCDSMASTASNHSQRSDNSYDYLSVEEKECLMFLEETIGSLDAEGDSGVSTDDTDCGEPPKPRKGPVPQDLGNGTPPPSRDQQRGAEQRNGKSSSASSSSAPAAAPSPGYSRLPRNVPAPNGASGSSVHTVPAGKAAQEVPREGRLDQASTGSRTKSVIIQPPDPFQDDLEWSRSHRSDTKSVIIQPPDPFQDDLEWSRSHRSAAKGEAARETKIWTFSDHPEKSTLEEAPQDPDAKRGPPTAPKPRKLPPNIILKTSRNSPVPPAMEHNQKVKAAPPPSATSHPSPASDSTAEKGNSGHLDPKEKEKARREALEKLGLSQDRRQPSAHLHPHPRETPLPIPGQPGGGSVPGIRQMAFKSNTLERSGVGLGSSMGSPKEQNARSSSSSLGKMSFIERLAPSFLRGSRPRPASLGAGKDFAGLKEQEEQDKSSKRRSHPLSSFPRPPRSAVSVKISPKGAADENRREALKKLGLLKE